ncbi:MAG: methyltransferase domain-containing protein [Nitrospinaceae bacterium]|jgi:ubiquinone/menaquinone biosynthesis C-methylase UbiE|nr:methyltransferase domain-containing protein [Nitrospinaceae bacterium]MBT6396207.1 methyltransferase domain-containing protein [Nitrospinaceae bacterium]
MTGSYRKDLSHITWAEVYKRQEMRAGLVEEWLEALALQPGDRVLDMGSGPGFVSLVLADRVGVGGVVYAIDRSAEALAYLEGLQRERGIVQIQRITADAAALEPADLPANLPADAAMISMVLHHADDPPGILRNVERMIVPGGRVLVAEFHPEGPGEQGPPQEHRIAPERIQAWCQDAGLAVQDYQRQTPESYMILAQRPF